MNITHNRDPIINIKRDVLRDHTLYLSSYIDYMIKAVLDDCRFGIHKYRECSDLMTEMTIRYPRMMAYMINPQESAKLGITHRSLQSEVIAQVGGDPQSAEEKITDIKSIFNKIGKIDLVQAQSIAISIMNELKVLQKLLQINGKNVESKGTILSPDTVLDNLQILMSIQSQERESKPQTEAINISVPPRNIKDISEIEPDQLQREIDLLKRAIDRIIAYITASDIADYDAIQSHLLPSVETTMIVLQKIQESDIQSGLSDKSLDTIRSIIAEYKSLPNDSFLKFYNRHMTDELAAKINIWIARKIGGDMQTGPEARTFINRYNREFRSPNKNIQSIFPDKIRLIPSNFFVGSYVERINNPLFAIVTKQQEEKIGLLDSLMNFRASKLERPSDSYKPTQEGGTLDIPKLRQEYGEISAKYAIYYNYIYSYMRYLILIATNRFFNGDYVVYKYINREMIESYKQIVTKIINNMESEPKIKQYYYVVVYKLKAFLEAASYYMKDTTDILDVESVSADDQPSQNLRDSLILLNHFKPILDLYK